MKKSLLILTAIISFGLAKAQTLAFPTAEGFGKYASGGRGGEVVEVTNLLDDPDNPPEGSFRWALKQHVGKPITVVFRTSGIIDLKGNDLRNMRDSVTIAGQTAPGDGICIKGGCVNLGGSRNLIIRHLRSRVGVLGDDTVYDPGNVDENNFIAGASLNIENGGDFIVDHCSFSWSAEETVGFYDNDHTTMQWCIVSEALYNAGHQKGNRGYGAVWGGKTATYHHNLLAHNYNRSPRLGATTKNDKHMLLDIVNNVNYNYGKANACYGGDNRQGDDGLFQVNYVNNYYKPGPAYTGDRKSYFIGASYNEESGQSYGEWHLDGNYMTGKYAEEKGYNTNNYNAFDISAYTENVAGLTLDDLKSGHIDVGEYAVGTQSAQEAYESVLAGAGAFPRDTHDTRVIGEAADGTAQYYGSQGAMGIIDKPSDSGGYPEYKTYGEITDDDHDGMDDEWEIANGFDPTNRDDRNTILKGGYTALEAYLCSLVGEEIAIEKETSRPYDIIVAQDGTGDCTTINQAIEMADEDAIRTTIFVRNGLYGEKVFVGNRNETSRKVISIIGESADSVIIAWDDCHGKTIDYPGEGIITTDSTSAATMTVTSPDFYMENVTVLNTSADLTTPAEAMYQTGDRQILKNVRICSLNSPHRAEAGNRYFLYGCTVTGNTDLICGGGTAYFYDSDIVNTTGSLTGINGQSAENDSQAPACIAIPGGTAYKTAMSDGKPLYYGLIFNGCRLTADYEDGDVYLGRPSAETDCGAVFMNSVLGSHINPLGWTGGGNNTSMSFAEYNNTGADGAPVDMTERTSWGMSLADEDMPLLNLDTVYSAGGDAAFSPEEAVVGVNPPSAVTNNDGYVSWAAVSGAIGYVVYLDGEIVGFVTSNGYFSPDNRDGAYTVRAVAENGALSTGGGTEQTLDVEELHDILNQYGRIRQECTITATASPGEGGEVSPTSVVCLQGDNVTLTATAADGYEFRNWTLASGQVCSTETVYTFEAEESVDLTANFALSQKERAYHQPVATDYEFELVDATLIPEQQPDAETGELQWQIKNEYTDWVSYNYYPVQVGERQVQIDPVTGEYTDSYYNYSTGNMIRIGTEKHLSFYLTGCSRAKIYFNGAASTTGHLVLDVVYNDGTEEEYASELETGKKTTIQSDTLSVCLDDTKDCALTLKGTQDMAIWALNLWPGASSGITDITPEAQNKEGHIYNLQGQRISRTIPGQIYVRNGNKFIER